MTWDQTFLAVHLLSATSTRSSILINRLPEVRLGRGCDIFLCCQSSKRSTSVDGLTADSGEECFNKCTARFIPRIHDSKTVQRR